eukprot:1222458-Prymnesium_polylepis.2
MRAIRDSSRITRVGLRITVEGHPEYVAGATAAHQCLAGLTLRNECVRFFHQHLSMAWVVNAIGVLHDAQRL